MTMFEPMADMMYGNERHALRSLFTRETAKRLDTVKKYLGVDEPKSRIRGGAPSKEVLAELGLRDERDQAMWPRHAQAYRVIAEGFPGFSWRPCTRSDTVAVRRKDEAGNETIMRESRERRWIEFGNYPTVEREHPSLADLSIESLRQAVAPHAPPHIEPDCFAPNVQQRVAPLLRGDTAKGLAFARMLVGLPIALPPMQVMEAVRGWWTRVLAGEPSTIFTPVCPDYATRATGDPLRPREYTFDAIGDGVGYVAQRALGVIPRCWNVLRTLGCENVRFVVGMGDFEADSAETCARVHVSREEFLASMRRSQSAFAAACPGDLPIETPLITGLDRARWDALLAAARAAVARGDYGPFRLTEDDIHVIARARHSLYARWYGEAVNARNVLDRQAPEYMAATELVSERYPNLLVLGADATAMAPFAQGMGSDMRPVLYLRNAGY